MFDNEQFYSVGQQRSETQPLCADHLLRDGGHSDSEPQRKGAPVSPFNGQAGHSAIAHQRPDADLTALCDHLRELHRQRQDLHRSEKSLTLQIKAKCRRLCGGDKTEAEALYKAMFGKGDHEMTAYALALSAPFIQARALIADQRKATEKEMATQAKRLPVAEWVEGVKGFGIGSLAAIVGEAGDLSNYPTVSKLWKRMGLAVIGGVRQQRMPGADALEHGYSPSRRSVVWNIGDPLVKCGDHYRKVYLDRKEVEVHKAEAEGLTVVPAAKIPAASKDQYRSQGHIHNRAKRYMEKRLLRDLWAAWRRYSENSETVVADSPDGNTPGEAEVVMPGE